MASLTDRPTPDPGARAWRRAAWGGAAALFLVPVVASRFAPGMDWSAFDFLLLAGLLLAACLAFDVAARASRSHAYRLAAAMAIGGGFFLFLANAAVGVIGHEGNAANLAFPVLLALGVAGAALVRLRAAGLARVMAGMAIGQAAIGVYAASVGSIEGTGLCALYVAGWLACAALFRRAAAQG